MDDYMVSPFTINVDLPFHSRTYSYLINTLTGGECMLPKNIWWAIKSEAPFPPESENLSMLIEHSFIVPSHYNGFEAYLAVRAQQADDFSFMGSHLSCTGRCPLRCRYCFVSGQTAVDMSARTARQIDRFYLGLIDRHGPERVHDIISGGEPTLNIGVAREIVERRNVFCREKGIPYSFTLKTNGTLLSRVSVREAVCAMTLHGLRNLDVSIGGPEAVHNAWRPAAGGQNSYRLTKRGLKAVSPHVPIRIVLITDLTAESFDRFFEPVEDFMESGIAISDVSVSGIFPRLQGGNFTHSLGTMDKLFYLHEVLEKNGFPVYRNPPKMHCGIDSNSYFVFDPSGRVVACPALTPDRQPVLGHVDTGVHMAAKRKLMGRNFLKACHNCEVLPLCGGSCRYEAEIISGLFNNVLCMKDHIRKVLDQYLLRKARASLHELEKEGRLP